MMGTAYLRHNDQTEISPHEAEVLDRMRRKFAESVAHRETPKIPSHAKVPQDPPPGCQACCCGKKWVNADDVRWHNTGAYFKNGNPLIALDKMCRECLPDVEGMAYIVCIGCKEIVGRTPPTVVKNGFPILADHYYHVWCCPNCNEKCPSTLQLVEYQEFEKYQADRKKHFSFGNPSL